MESNIIPVGKQKYKIQLAVLNRDIASIKIGNTVKYHFYALPYKEYDELTGKIQKISTDTKFNPKDGTSYYLVEADIESKTLYGRKGEKVDIKVGMTCEAQIRSADYQWK